MIKILAFTLLSLLSTSAFSAYYDTLPAGVRMIVFKNVNSTTVNSQLDKDGRINDMKVEVDASAKELAALNDQYVNAFLDLYKQYPDAFKALSLGHFKASVEADVSVNAYGFAYGITDRISAYAALPIYKADVRMKFNRASSSTFNQVAEILQSYTGDDYAQSLGNITQSFYEVDGNMLQSIVVNGYGYNEVGDWSAQGPGDMEFGLLYNFYKGEDFGMLVTLGGAAPTGYVDDPDLLQDIGFGDGQWDGFIELGGDYRLSNGLNTYLWSRYTYQFSSEKELRIPTSADFPLSDQKGVFEEKLGNSLLTATGIDYTLNDWAAINFEYQIYSREKASYSSQYTAANEYLAANTGSTKQVLKSVFTLSSVQPFLKQKFLLPAMVKIGYEKLVYGTNTPDNDLITLEFRMMF